MDLRLLTSDEYDKYLEKSIKNYADELVKSGISDEEKSISVSKKTFFSLLPDGLKTKDNYLYFTYYHEELVGFIWYGFRNKEQAFIYDFYIEENMRRKGFGKMVITACEEDARKKGAKSIGLHVFGHNKAAIALYESLDYIPTSIQMKKELQ